MSFPRYIDKLKARFTALITLVIFIITSFPAPFAYAEDPASDPYVEIQQIGQACVESMNDESSSRAAPYQALASQIFVAPNPIAKKISRSDLKSQMTKLMSSPDIKQKEEKFAQDSTWVYMTHALHNWKRRSYEVTGSPEIDVELFKSIPEVGGPLNFIKPIWKKVPTDVTLKNPEVLTLEVIAFNGFITLINQTCADSNIVYKKLMEAYRDKIKQDPQWNPGLYELLDKNENGMIIQGGIQGRIRNRISQLRTSATIDTSILQAMISQSVFGSMYNIDTPFRKHVGQLNNMACVENGQQLKTISVGKVKQILNDSAKKLNEKSQASIFNIVKRLYNGDQLKQHFAETYHESIQQAAHKMDADDLLKQYIQENPFSLQQALLAHPNKENALLACQLIREIKQSNINKEDALTAFSVFAAVFTAGASFVAEGAVATVATIAAIAMDAYFFISSIMDFNLSYEIQDRLEASVLANQIDPLVGKELINNVENSRAFSVVNMALSGLGLTAATARASQLSKLSSLRRRSKLFTDDYKIMSRSEIRNLARNTEISPTGGGSTGKTVNDFPLINSVRNGKNLPGGGATKASQQEINSIRNWINDLPATSKPTPKGGSRGSTGGTGTATLTKPAARVKANATVKPSVTNQISKPATLQTKIKIGDEVKIRKPIVAPPVTQINVDDEVENDGQFSPLMPRNLMEEAKKLLQNGGLYDPQYKNEICQIAQNDSGVLGKAALDMIAANNIECPEMSGGSASSSLNNPFTWNNSDDVAKELFKLISQAPNLPGSWQAINIEFKKSTAGNPNDDRYRTTSKAEVILFDKITQQFLVVEPSGYARWLNPMDVRLEFLNTTTSTKTNKIKFYNAPRSKEQKIFRDAFNRRELNPGTEIIISGNKPAVIWGQRGDNVVVLIDNMGSVARIMNQNELNNTGFKPDPIIGPKIPLNKRKNKIMAQNIDNEFGKLVDELGYYNQHLLSDHQSAIPKDVYDRLRILSAIKLDFDKAWAYDYDGSALEQIYENIRNLYYSSIMYMEDILKSHGFKTQWIVKENRTVLKITLPAGIESKDDKELFFDPIYAYVRQPTSNDFRYYDFGSIQFLFTDYDLDTVDDPTFSQAPFISPRDFNVIKERSNHIQDLTEQRNKLIHGPDGFDNHENMELIVRLENFTIKESEYYLLATRLGVEPSRLINLQNQIFDELEFQVNDIEQLFKKYGYTTIRIPFMRGSNRRILKIRPKGEDGFKSLLSGLDPDTGIYFDPFLDNAEKYPVNRFLPYFNDINLYLSALDVENLIQGNPNDYILNQKITRVAFAIMRKNHVENIYHQHYLYPNSVNFSSAEELPIRIDSMLQIAQQLINKSKEVTARDFERELNFVTDEAAVILEDSKKFVNALRTKKIFSFYPIEDVNSDFALYMRHEDGKILVINLVDAQDIVNAKAFIDKYMGSGSSFDYDKQVERDPDDLTRALMDAAIKQQYKLNGYAYALRMDAGKIQEVFSKYKQNPTEVNARNLILAIKRIKTVANLPVVNRVKRDDDYWKYVIQVGPFNPQRN